MAERRTLSQRVHSPVHTNSEAVRAFVTQEPQALPAVGASSPPTPLPTINNAFPVGLIPITVRLSPEIAGALKRISLERQLARADYFSQQEIVERALKAWLQQNAISAT
jgi:hypothetical protein